MPAKRVLMRSGKGIQTLSPAPNRMIEFPDGAMLIGINRKAERGLYVAVTVLPDGRVAAHGAPTRDEAVKANIRELGMSESQVVQYHGNNVVLDDA